MGTGVLIYRTRPGLGHPETAGLVKKAVSAVLEAEGVTAPCRVDVTLTDDGTIHRINFENRGVDSPTDVLSFPMAELEPGKFCPESCEKDLDRGTPFGGHGDIDTPLRGPGGGVRPWLPP